MPGSDDRTFLVRQWVEFFCQSTYLEYPSTAAGWHHVVVCADDYLTIGYDYRNAIHCLYGASAGS